MRLWIRHITWAACAAAFALVPVPTPECGELELTSRLESDRTAKTRLLLDVGALRAVALDMREQEGTGEATFGAEGGPVTFGAVDLSGLYSVVAGPLSPEPGSELWEEPSRLSLDTGLDPVSRFGGELELLEGRLAVSIYEDADALTGAAAMSLWGGGATRGAGAGSSGGAELLTYVSQVVATDGDESWYPETPGFAGGRLAGGIAEMSVALGPKLSVAALAAASAGAFAPPGYAAVLRGRFSGGERLEAAVISGVEHPSYRGPDGRRPREASVLGAEAGLGLGALTRLELGAVVSRLDPPRPRPSRAGETEPPREREVAAGLEVGGEEGLSGAFGAERTWLRNEEGAQSTESELGLGAGYRGEVLRATVEAERELETTDIDTPDEHSRHSDALRQEVGMNAGWFRLEQWLRLLWEDGVDGTGDPEVEGAVEISAVFTRVAFTLRAETARPIAVAQDGRERVASQPGEFLTVRLEVTVGLEAPGLDAEDEAGYLEVYGKPGDVYDRSHEGAGHDRRIEADAMDE